MKTLATRALGGCLIAVACACSSAAAPAAAGRAAPSPHGAAACPVRPGATASVKAVVTGYYRVILRRNYRCAFGYVAPGATGPDGHKLTLSSFLQLAHMLDGMGGPVTKFSIGIAPSGVVLTLSRARYGPYHAHLLMVRTRHGWEIGSLDRI